MTRFKLNITLLDGFFSIFTGKFLLPSSCNKLAPIEPPRPDIGMPEGSPLLLSLHPGPPHGCLPVLLPHPGHPVHQTGGVNLGSKTAVLRALLNPPKDDAPLLVCTLPPTDQALSTQL